ncbi:MAG: YbaN family protein [Candidatus Thalassarchaeaceae archaeon]|nr:YbaN family protein [Candidatus Thalassarchaeaceae archaeon]MDP6703259.1 YbaN family protein [Candidatus Thalassarchaeaceae archaeon]MDP7004030.1 YbaN family protein [Candidatus Thalassarchaeaceae archaeon]
MNRLQTIDEIVERYCVASTPGKSRLYVGLGTLFLAFAVIGIWVPGWPTVSWAVPAAFLFSLSSERMFRITLTNRYFGPAMYEYYATGKTLPRHVKFLIVVMIGIMASVSAYLVWYVSTRGDGVLWVPSTWNGPDPGFGAGAIILVGLIGIWYVQVKVNTRE